MRAGIRAGVSGGKVQVGNTVAFVKRKKKICKTFALVEKESTYAGDSNFL